MKNVSNKNARESVKARKVFKGNNTFAEQKGNAYAVYSYGRHFPLFVFVGGVWYENEDKYSTTTSKHRSQLHPLLGTVKVSTDQMKDIIG